ncbi:MAG TPA: hypothetical protein VKS03_10075, partial [Thermoanaerobaculia bacterium]|nr:hypothetical protein [Thermoanaerobaculia bacterium]
MAVAFLFLAFFFSSAGVPASSTFRVLDDTGQEVSAPIRVCFYAGLLTECLDQTPYRIPPTLAAFTSVTAEGPGHGPIAVERRALQQDRAGAYLLRMPRKARVLLRASAGPPLAVSLYPVDDASFRKPAFRASGVGSEGVLVPAGDFVLVVS